MAMKRVRKLEQMGLQSAPKDSKTVALQLDGDEFDVLVAAIRASAKVWRQAAKTSTQEADPEEERKVTRQMVKEAKFLEGMATRLVHAAAVQP
jgi:hypothetical protein